MTRTASFKLLSFLLCAALLMGVALLWGAPAAAQDESQPAPEATEEFGAVDCEAIAPGASATYFIGAANAFFAQQNYTEAIRLYTCAILGNPDYAPAYTNRGYAFYVQRADPEALADYNRALELDPVSAVAYNYRGMLYTTQGNFGLAIGDFTVAVTLVPEYAAAFNNRAVVHAAEGNYELAIADIQQAIALDESAAAPYATLGAVYSALAMQSYAEYHARAGEQTRLPNGEPDEFFNALEAGREIGSFSAWLSLLTRQ